MSVFYYRQQYFHSSEDRRWQEVEIHRGYWPGPTGPSRVRSLHREWPCSVEAASPDHSQATFPQLVPRPEMCPKRVSIYLLREDKEHPKKNLWGGLAMLKDQSTQNVGGFFHFFFLLHLVVHLLCIPYSESPHLPSAFNARENPFKGVWTPWVGLDAPKFQSERKTSQKLKRGFHTTGIPSR